MKNNKQRTKPQIAKRFGYVPGLRTWGEIKSMIEHDLDVKDDDYVFMIDIGPNADKLFKDNDGTDGGIEISDDPITISNI